MLTFEDAKKIIDHFYIGRLITFEELDSYSKTETNQGVFFILASDPIEGRKTEQYRQSILEQTVGKVKRVLLSDSTGTMNPDSSYAHYKDRYFSVYKLVN